MHDTNVWVRVPLSSTDLRGRDDSVMAPKGNGRSDTIKLLHRNVDDNVVSRLVSGPARFGQK